MISAISPTNAIANKTMVSKRVALNSQGAYSDTLNCCKPTGRRLDVNTNKLIVNDNNHKIDYYA